MSASGAAAAASFKEAILQRAEEDFFWLGLPGWLLGTAKKVPSKRATIIFLWLAR